MIIILLSCTTKETKLLNAAEKFCVSQLDNPKSYSLDSIMIVDTMTEQMEYIRFVENYLSDLKHKIEIDSSMIEMEQNGLKGYYDCEPCVKSSIKKVKEYKNKIIENKILLNVERSSLSEAKAQKDTTEIIEIYIYIYFRASNKFGAIVKNNKYIIYRPKEGFEMEF